MNEPYLPPELWRVAVKATRGHGYGDPTGKTFARESVARKYAEQAATRGYEVRLFRAEPAWNEVAA